MPRQSSGPHLWFDKKRKKWTVVDGKKKTRTGFGLAEVGEAEKVLEAYLTDKHEPVVEGADPLISDLMVTYAAEVIAGKASEDHVLAKIRWVVSWWGDKTVSQITVKLSKEYYVYRNSRDAAVREEMSYLQAAIRHWGETHTSLSMPPMWKPKKVGNRVRWLTRSEAAKFLWSCRRTYLARAFIIGWYTGSRKCVILDTRWSRIDLESRILFRKPPGAVQTKKRAPPIRIGRRLYFHLKRWHRMDSKLELANPDLVVRHSPTLVKPMRQVDRIWHATRIAAKLSKDVTPHVLRHSRATHLMKQGIDPWQSAQFLGMSLRLLETTYGHHRPDWQLDAADAR